MKTCTHIDELVDIVTSKGCDEEVPDNGNNTDLIEHLVCVWVCVCVCGCVCVCVGVCGGGVYETIVFSISEFNMKDLQ